MTTELRQAAIRLKDYSWMKINGPLLSPAVAKAFKDMHEVSTAYLAEHLEDDDDPITEEWVRIVGFEPHCEGSEHYYHRSVPVVLVRLTGGTRAIWVGSSTVGWHDVSKEATRGQLRKLCSALGVELKS